MLKVDFRKLKFKNIIGNFVYQKARKKRKKKKKEGTPQ